MRACRAGFPNTVMLPVVGLSRSAIKRIRVLLPHPLGPISETNSPGATVMLTVSRAVTVAPFVPPKTRLTPETSTADVAGRAVGRADVVGEPVGAAREGTPAAGVPGDDVSFV